MVKDWSPAALVNFAKSRPSQHQVGDMLGDARKYINAKRLFLKKYS